MGARSSSEAQDFVPVREQGGYVKRYVPVPRRTGKAIFDALNEGRHDVEQLLYDGQPIDIYDDDNIIFMLERNPITVIRTPAPSYFRREEPTLEQLREAYRRSQEPPPAPRKTRAPRR